MPHLGNPVVSELPVRLEGRHNVQRLARSLARTDRASVNLESPRENGGRSATGGRFFAFQKSNALSYVRRT